MSEREPVKVELPWFVWFLGLMILFALWDIGMTLEKIRENGLSVWSH